MSSEKPKNSKNYVDIRPQGRNGPRFRKTFKTAAEANAYKRYILENYSTKKPWHCQQADRRTLSELVKVWYELHGNQLKSGHKRLSDLNKLVDMLNDPQAQDFDAKMFSKLRAKRLKEVTPSTVNHDLTNMRALFSELKRLGEWSGPNPLEDIRKIKLDERELAYLEKDQIYALLNELDKTPKSHARITARICLATGARWGEAATLKANQVKNGRINFSKTKTGQNRSIPISPELEELILQHAPLIDGYNTFKRSVARMGLKLPRSQLTHILRHTFASHFMIKGGNIIALQRILGHSSLTMTCRYAHLSPDHLTEAIKLNPLSDFE